MAASPSSPSQVTHAHELYAEGGRTVAYIAGLVKVSRQTIYWAVEPEAVNNLDLKPAEPGAGLPAPGSAVRQ